MKKKEIQIRKLEGTYYVIDVGNSIKYPIDDNNCLIKQLNDICEIIFLKGEYYDENPRHKNREESKRSV